MDTLVCPCHEQIGVLPTPNQAIVGGFGFLPDTECGEVDILAGPFLRGDCNGDGAHNIADAIYTGNFLGGAGNPGPCQDACDSNDDGNVDIADIIYSLQYLFANGPSLPEPYFDCGGDVTPDELDCAGAVIECP